MSRSHDRAGAPLRLREVFGLDPLGPALAQCWLALRGDAYTPSTQYDLSSLRMFRPWHSLRLWTSREPAPGRALVYLLPNRRPPPPHEGYSVRITDCVDFRGRQLTYDGHFGTDCAVPAGTTVCAPAPARVHDVRMEMNRGGLKVVLDHGGGLLTACNHLGRALVRPGEIVQRGQAIALSGMSSIDGLLFFPWLAPHLHINVTLGGVAVDPWAREGEVSLWRGGRNPEPPTPPSQDHPSEDAPTFDADWDEAAVRASIDACRDPEIRREITAQPSLHEKACDVVKWRIFRGQIFDAFPTLMEPPVRRPLLSLPFERSRYSGVVFADDVRGAS